MKEGKPKEHRLSEGVKEQRANWMCWILATSVVLPRGQQCCLVHSADAELTQSMLMYMEEQPLEQKDQVVLYVYL